eukprot:CAMPEP_0197540712 /NCGR_PEP_ID=MMETSP1318-20131121/66751_1 /TAXON_ID=552666 /ORGANISM="Partenskyella glossopodia, Strain RCC365" /LENGTH=310 /DNA_ID=CAMNT_0043099797 /DNA_START=6 /DNA_END=938 /DNA_ORIENTATION=-
MTNLAIDQRLSVQSETEEEFSSDDFDDNSSSLSSSNNSSKINLQSLGVDQVCLPFGGSVVVTTETEAKAKYFSRRKILLCNGTHTTLAFITLVKEMQKNQNESVTPLSDMGLPGNYKLLDFARADEEGKRMIWAWLLARCYIITQEFSEEVLKSSHGVSSMKEAVKSLVDYAWIMLQRFSKVPDTTGRVLSGGVVKRYNGRLKNVLESVRNFQNQKQDTKESKQSLSAEQSLNMVLEAAAEDTTAGRPDVSKRFMYQALRDLVSDAMPIAKEKERRDSGLVATSNASSPVETRKYRFMSAMRKLFWSSSQ